MRGTFSEIQRDLGIPVVTIQGNAQHDSCFGKS